MESQPLSQSVYYDHEAQEDYVETKLQRTIRHGFIRKVYGIVLCQLLVTVLVGGFFTLHDAARVWMVTKGLPMLLVCGITALILCVAMSCVPSLARNYPGNYFLLGGFTVAEAVGLGGACAIASLQSGKLVVLQALVCTLVLVLGLTLFACQTKYDFVSWAPYVLVALLGFMVFGFVSMFFPKNRIIDTLFSAGMAVVFSVYLLIDTQLIIGRHKQRIPTEDFILVALTFYLDIVNLFLYILRLLGSLQKSNGD